MSKTSARDGEAGPGSARIVVFTGLVLSGAMGLLDGAMGALLDPIPFSSLGLLLLPMALTAGSFFLVYMLLWLVAVSHGARFFGLGVLPAAISLAVFLGTHFALTLPYGWLLVRPLWSFSEEYLPQSLFFLLISLLASIVALWVAKRAVAGPEDRRTGLFFILGGMGILGMVTVLGWLFRYEIGLFVLSPSVQVSVFYAWVVIAGTASIRVAARRISAVRLLALSLSLMLLTPFVSLAVAKVSHRPFIQGAGTSHRVKHVILITVDTLRADALNGSVSKTSLMPHLDELAGDGFLFTRAYASAPWTLPSLASVMTGLPVSVHQTKEKTSRLPHSIPTLAQYLRDAGYLTLGVVMNKWLSPGSNMSKGFVEYHFFPNNHNSFGLSLFTRLFPEQSLYPYKIAAELTEFTVKRISPIQHESFFLWLHLIDPHHPYTPPDEYIPHRGEELSIDKDQLKHWPSEFRDGTFVPTPDQREMIKTLYGGEVRYVDESLGEFIAYLKESGLYDDSLIIFTSDHGEEFWEHGGVDHGHTLYDELLRVPLIIKIPGGRSREVLNSVVSLESITPTVLEACEITVDFDHFSHGSLSPLLGLSQGPYLEKAVVSTGLLYYEDRESVVFDGHKYIRNLLTMDEELYNLETDPGEKESVLSLFPDRVRKAKDILQKHQEDSAKIRERFGIVEGEKTELDDSTLWHLKALGYL